MRNRRIYRAETRPRAAPHRSRSSGVPRLRLRGSGAGHRGTAGNLARRRTGSEAPGSRRVGARRRRYGHLRHSSYPLGDPRRAQRAQRASAYRRVGEDRPGAQRHHREPSIYPPIPFHKRRYVLQRHRHRSAGAVDRLPVRRRQRHGPRSAVDGRVRRTARGAGHVRDRRRLRAASGTAHSRPPRQPAAHRHRGRRAPDLVRRGGDRRAYQPRRLPE